MSEKNNLQKQLDDLQSIIDWFESDDIEIEQAIDKFEKGQKQAELIKKQLNELDNQITVLKQKFDS